MALNATTLAALIKANLAAEPSTGFKADDPGADPFCEAIAAAVVQHILSSAVVNVSGVIAGTGGGAAPVVGTCTAAGTVT
jgi:hypothetical protein